MAKASQPGRSKTRLSPPLTPEEAASFNTAFIKDIAEHLLIASAERSLAGSMAFGPPESRDFFVSNLPASIALHEVWYPNFGKCLGEAMKCQFAAGHEAACVLNSDSPTLPVAILKEMVDVLAAPGDRAVLGPSTDGGYYLLACNKFHSRLFEDISWSTEIVAAQTLERAREIGLPVHTLPKWYDVDDCASLMLLASELLEGKSFSLGLQSSPARHSQTLLTSLFRTSQLQERLDRFAKAGATAPATLKEAAA
jgi:uncharacterized protein